MEGQGSTIKGYFLGAQAIMLVALLLSIAVTVVAPSLLLFSEWGSLASMPRLCLVSHYQVFISRARQIRVVTTVTLGSCALLLLSFQIVSTVEYIAVRTRRRQWKIGCAVGLVVLAMGALWLGVAGLGHLVRLCVALNEIAANYSNRVLPKACLTAGELSLIQSKTTLLIVCISLQASAQLLMVVGLLVLPGRAFLRELYQLEALRLGLKKRAEDEQMEDRMVQNSSQVQLLPLESYIREQVQQESIMLHIQQPRHGVQPSLLTQTSVQTEQRQYVGIGVQGFSAQPITTQPNPQKQQQTQTAPILGEPVVTDISYPQQQPQMRSICRQVAITIEPNPSRQPDSALSQDQGYYYTEGHSSSSQIRRAPKTETNNHRHSSTYSKSSINRMGWSIINE